MPGSFIKPFVPPSWPALAGAKAGLLLRAILSSMLGASSSSSSSTKQGLPSPLPARPTHLHRPGSLPRFIDAHLAVLADRGEASSIWAPSQAEDLKGRPVPTGGHPSSPTEDCMGHKTHGGKVGRPPWQPNPSRVQLKCQCVHTQAAASVGFSTLRGLLCAGHLSPEC